jgi:saccharopine dehydrogenase (NADP+, L-glutamate forming)
MHKILVLGSGLVSRPLIRYFLSKNDVELTIATPDGEVAENMIRGFSNGRAISLDLAREDELRDMISAHDIVVSLLPYVYHVDIAKLCITLKKNLFTTSYTSPEMAELNEDAVKAGILILNEIGLDPGIDHMAAMKIFDYHRTRGGKITGFESYCGGLPSPADNDNPFGYKFSWSPKGVLKAGKNSARFKKDGRVIQVESQDLFDNCWPLEIEGFEAKLEGYPNRDSMQYIDLYNLGDIKTMLRGTIRYEGWCRILKKIVDLDLLDENQYENLMGLTCSEFVAQMINKPEADDIRKSTASFLGTSENSREIEALDWLGLFSKERIPTDIKPAPIDILTWIMQKKMVYEKGERDMIIQRHRFTIEYPCCVKVVTSTMIDYGTPNGDTAMARTVSLPCAIAMHRVLKGEIKQTGVRIPTSPDIYNPVLSELETMGIRFVDKEEVLS